MLRPLLWPQLLKSIACKQKITQKYEIALLSTPKAPSCPLSHNHPTFLLLFCNPDWLQQNRRGTPIQTTPSNSRSAVTAANSNLQLLARYRRLPTLCIGIKWWFLPLSHLCSLIGLASEPSEFKFDKRVTKCWIVKFQKSSKVWWASSLSHSLALLNSSVIEFHRKVSKHIELMVRPEILMSTPPQRGSPCTCFGTPRVS